MLSIPVTLIIGPLERQVIERISESTGVSVPEYWGDPPMRPLMYLVLGFVMLFAGSIFSTIGGLIGSAIFRKPPHPGFIDVPPQP